MPREARAGRRLAAAIGVVAVAFALGARPAAAATPASTSVGCTGVRATDAAALIAAITAADAATGTQVISLAAACTYTLAGVDNSTDGPTGLPVVTGTLTIAGNGATISRSTAHTTPGFRLLDVAGAGSLVLDGLTLSNGSVATGAGGAVESHGTLSVTNSTVSGNAAGAGGGGVDATGPLSIATSTIAANTTPLNGGGIRAAAASLLSAVTLSGNSAGFDGGGAAVSSSIRVTGSSVTDNRAGYFGGGLFTSSDLTVGSSAITGNRAVLGGGGVLAQGVAVLTTTTLSGNQGGSGDGGGLLGLSTASATLVADTVSANSAGRGGGIALAGGGAVVNTTVTGNDATSGGGIATGAAAVSIMDSTIAANRATAVAGGVVTTATGAVSIANSIVADNSVNNCGVAGAATAVVDGGHDLESGRSCGFTHSAVTAEPGLGTLHDNGGATATMAISTTSPAYSAGDPALCAAAQPAGAGATDQRGQPRKTVIPCDIGAYEDLTVVTRPATPGPSGVAAASITVPSTGAGDDTRGELVAALLVIITGLLALGFADLARSRSGVRRDGPRHRLP